MTKPIDRAVATGLLFPDYVRLLKQAARVETVAVRSCEVCGSSESALKRMQSYDGFICEAETDCGRRALKGRRIA